MPLEWIDKYPNKPWEWGWISKNIHLTQEWINKYPDKPWDWGIWGISDNKNITLELIEKYIDKPWDFNIIKLSYQVVFEKYARNYLAAYRIQQWWYKITLSPKYNIGRKFINRKYNKLFIDLLED